jgi:hypothetical protein
MANKRLIPILSPLIIWLLSQAFLWRPEIFFPVLSLGALLIVLGTKYVMGRNPEDWPLFISAPLLFWISFSGYVAVVTDPVLIQAVFLLEAWFVFIYLRDLYYYSNQSEADWSPRLDNLFMAGGFLTAFAASAVFFALPAFLTVPFGLSAAVLYLTLALLLSQFFANKKEHWNHSILILGVTIVIIMELVGAISLLPLNFNVLALFSALIYYFCLTVMRLYYTGSLHRRALKLPLLLSALALLILLLTARWL